MTAMKARDKVRTEALRMIKKNFIEAKTAPGSNGELTDEQAIKIIAKMAKSGHDQAKFFTDNNRPDLAEAEEAQAKIYDEYLPQQLSPEELEKEVRAIIAEVGATSMKEMGKVMGTATKRLAGKADGGAISALVRHNCWDKLKKRGNDFSFFLYLTKSGLYKRSYNPLFM